MYGKSENDQKNQLGIRGMAGIHSLSCGIVLASETVLASIYLQIIDGLYGHQTVEISTLLDIISFAVVKVSKEVKQSLCLIYGRNGLTDWSNKLMKTVGVGS